MSTIFQNNMSWNNQQSRTYPRYIFLCAYIPPSMLISSFETEPNVRRLIVYWKLTPPIRNFKDIDNDRLLFKKMDYIKTQCMEANPIS